jgi:hypothetical protein
MLTKTGKKMVFGIITEAIKSLLARHFYKDGVKTGIWEFYNIQGPFHGPIISILPPPPI